MKRTESELQQLPNDVRLNRFGHVVRTDPLDLRPGCLRDEDANLPLSRLQKIQKKLGWATIANGMSALRPPLAAAGITLLATGQHEAGVATLAAAALTDAEGKPARLTGTDDPVSGARNDVLADGAAAAAIGIGAVVGGIIPGGSMLGIYGPKAINGVNVWQAEREGLTVYTDRIDKTVEAARWVVAGLYVAAYTNVQPLATEIDWETAAHYGMLSVAAAGLYSSYRQIRRRQKASKAKTVEQAFVADPTDSEQSDIS